MGPYMITYGLFGSFISQLQKVMVMKKIVHQVMAVLVIGMLTGAMALLPVFLVLLLLGLIFFLVRTGRHALVNNPIGGGTKAWAFFGTLWLVVFVGLFIYAIMAFAEDFSAIPPWYGVIFAHSAFVGMMTSLLLGVYAIRAQDQAHVLSWGEPAAMWIMNVGLVVFTALKFTSDSRLGAIVMGVGVLLGVATILLRLQSDRAPAAVPSATD